ncbi:MAG: hypothetical protein OEO20_11080 [Gemmatimonadota bacterium]|nr:hypothetical protein [Gemmatimonadota bacterium]MDH3366733.1 hypothetical protein [Gemmatimonadota bacterium]MDH3478836.1 hypothetical protein [Gemmatimonadota bacterium]MDH3569022.1 hypothetical protein [Gemmatimonadota bacterium]MDH5550137.1 hypothetical protein [Gemmatimonadota bacterium]
MMTRRCGSMVGGVAVVLGGLFLAAPAHAQVKDTLDLDKIPQQVMDALRARFPRAEIRQWTREEEDDIVLYDIEFTQQGRKLEADIKEDGTIHNWEREIAADDLPASVRTAVEREYPESTLEEVMAITAVTEGTEALEGYEIVLETADGKEIEVTVAPDGTILERPEAMR